MEVLPPPSSLDIFRTPTINESFERQPREKDAAAEELRSAFQRLYTPDWQGLGKPSQSPICKMEDLQTSLADQGTRKETEIVALTPLLRDQGVMQTEFQTGLTPFLTTPFLPGLTPKLEQMAPVTQKVECPKEEEKLIPRKAAKPVNKAKEEVEKAPKEMDPVKLDLQRLHKKKIREAAIIRLRQKRADRKHGVKQVRYQCRKKIADSRPRVKGRFIRKGETLPTANTDYLTCLDTDLLAE